MLIRTLFLLDVLAAMAVLCIGAALFVLFNDERTKRWEHRFRRWRKRIELYRARRPKRKDPPE